MAKSKTKATSGDAVVFEGGIYEVDDHQPHPNGLRARRPEGEQTTFKAVTLRQDEVVEADAEAVMDAARRLGGVMIRTVTVPANVVEKGADAIDEFRDKYTAAVMKNISDLELLLNDDGSDSYFITPNRVIANPAGLPAIDVPKSTKSKSKG